MAGSKASIAAAYKTEARHLSPAPECGIAAAPMPLSLPPPALPAIELPLAAALTVSCVLGAGLALQAWRTGITTPGRALLGAALPATLWLLVAALNPERPTQLVLTPVGAGLAASFCCGLLAARRAARRTCCSTQRSFDCYFWSCGAALLGAKLFYWLGKLGSDPAVLTPNGLSASGALLGATLCAWWCFRQQPLLGRTWLDAFAPTLGLALALSWTGAYLQDPTRSLALILSAAGLLLAALTLTLSIVQRCHGQSFVLAALGYGIVQLSDAWLGSTRGGVDWLSSVASWLVIVLALVAGGVWRKAFTSSGI